MSKLTTLRGKDPKEAARLLSLVSSSLLPNPRLDDFIEETGTDRDFVQAVLTELREKLRVREGDYSPAAQSRMFSFLSEEISSATLANVNLDEVRDRLANKGDLHPSQYKIRFTEKFAIDEALGSRKAQILEALTRPDHTITIGPKYVSDQKRARFSISLKSISTRRPEDNFTWIILSVRWGHALYVTATIRAYSSEIDLRNIVDPLELLKSFVTVYGLPFRMGAVLSSFMNNELLALEPGTAEEHASQMKPLYAERGTPFLPVYYASDTNIVGTGGAPLVEVVLGFIVDATKYIATLRKHHVNVAPDAEFNFARM